MAHSGKQSKRISRLIEQNYGSEQGEGVMLEKYVRIAKKREEIRRQHGPVKHIRFDDKGNKISEEVIDITK